MMRRSRVGTLSMALVMIISGILLLWAEFFNGRSVVVEAIRWWPLILLLLGGEVLWYAFSAKEEQPKVKYDIFSIFIIAIVVIFSMGLYALSEVGLLAQAKEALANQSYQLKTTAPEIKLASEIKKIVISAPESGLTLRTVSGDTVLASGEVTVEAASQAAAEALLGDSPLLSKQVGDTLFLSFVQVYDGNKFGSHLRSSGFTLVVPGNRQLDIQGGSEVTVYGEKLAADLLLSRTGDATIELPADADLRLTADLQSAADFAGNVDWKISALTTAGEDSAEDSAENKSRGLLTFGKGTNKISILDGSRITVNQIL